jgi:hypothetical protein
MQIIRGLFYGTGCHQPFLMPILVRDGVERILSVDDLNVSFWVKQQEVNKCMVTWRQLRCTFTRVLGSNVTMDGKYTLYFEKSVAATPQNNILRGMGTMSGSQETVRGSVVVIKQRHDAPNLIMDMTKCDQLAVNYLLSRYARDLCRS